VGARKGLLVGLGAVLVAGLMLAGAGSAARPGSADLRISMTDSPDPVALNGQLTYTIGVENHGPDPATGVTVVDRLPSSVGLVSVTGPPRPCATQGGKLICSLGTLNPVGVNYGGAQATITTVVTPRRAGTIRNHASVRADQRDSSRGDNRAVAATTVLAVPTCRGRPATVSGSPGPDVLFGTSGPDVIVALGGSDRIVSRAGRDLVCAGVGRDRVRAGTAADRVFAGPGRDRVLGQGGPDLLRGSGGNDTLKGGRGNDRLRGGRGIDRCLGGRGADSIRGCER
jgi:uncharacterized repeat protein (TIGR01451 family)